MSDQSESSPSLAKNENSKAPINKPKKSVKVVLHLSAELAWKLDYACIMLRGNPKIAHKPDEMTALALSSIFDSLEKKGIVSFPPFPQY